MQVGVTLITDEQAAVGVQPGEVALYYPPKATQARAGLDLSAGDAGRDAALAHGAAVARGVVLLVRVQFRRAPTRSAQLPARLVDRRDGVEQARQYGAGVDVGGRQERRQRDALALRDQVVLAAGFRPIDRVRPGATAPLFAEMREASARARLQSIRSASPSRFSSAWCSRRHPPARCQSRRRRQQVMPLPQPISWGRYSHWMPVLSTKMMPVSAARSGTRGRPPAGFGGSGGSSGSIAVHSESLTNGFAMPHCTHDPGRFC